MAELNDFLNLISEAKKEAESQIKEETVVPLVETPLTKPKIKKPSLDFSLKLEGTSFLSQLETEMVKSKEIEKVEKVKEEAIFSFFESIPVSLDSTVESVDEIEQPPIEEESEIILTDELWEILEETPKELPVEIQQQEIVEPVVEKVDLTDPSHYTKLFKTNTDHFNQPDAPKVDPNFKALTDKVKYMEDWLTKISMAGPGSGEVNLRYLDDIDRSTIQDDRYLRYDAHTKKFVFDHPSGSQIGVLDYLALNTNGPGEVPLPGTLSWNPSEDCLNVTQNDGSTLQVGLENYILVHNHTGSNLYNGDVVKFSGVDTSVPDLPLCALMTADYAAQPLYLIGVLTNDIPIGQTGRATILGRVHDLNTTGSDVGEIWNVGDILWVHPTLPGKLTKTKPTLPQVAISVAAVVKSGVTDGTLLVRPSIWPRLLYGVFSNTTNHTASATNTAYPIDLDTINITSGFNLVSNSHITTVESGLYNFNVSIQMSSTNSSSKNIYFWVRKNGTDIPYSTRSVTVDGNNTQATFNCNWPISMNAGQYVQLMWAVSDTTIRLDAPSSTAFAPATPSVLVSITQAAL